MTFVVDKVSRGLLSCYFGFSLLIFHQCSVFTFINTSFINTNEMQLFSFYLVL